MARKVSDCRKRVKHPVWASRERGFAGGAFCEGGPVNAQVNGDDFRVEGAGGSQLAGRPTRIGPSEGEKLPLKYPVVSNEQREELQEYRGMIMEQ